MGYFIYFLLNIKLDKQKQMSLPKKCFLKTFLDWIDQNNNGLFHLLFAWRKAYAEASMRFLLDIKYWSAMLMSKQCRWVCPKSALKSFLDWNWTKLVILPQIFFTTPAKRNGCQACNLRALQTIHLLIEPFRYCWFEVPKKNFFKSSAHLAETTNVLLDNVQLSRDHKPLCQRFFCSTVDYNVRTSSIDIMGCYDE